MVASHGGWGWGEQSRRVGESTGCFIMQKLSRQLGRSCSAPLHYHRGRRRWWYTVGGGSLEKASAPESGKYGQPFCDKLFFGRGAARRVGASEKAKNFGHVREKRKARRMVWWYSMRKPSADYRDRARELLRKYVHTHTYIHAHAHLCAVCDTVWK